MHMQVFGPRPGITGRLGLTFHPFAFVRLVPYQRSAIATNSFNTPSSSITLSVTEYVTRGGTVGS